MEVNGAPLLVLGDLGEGNPGVLAEPTLRESRALGDLPAQVDGEASPKGTGVGVPQDGRFVVVGVRVERGAKGVVVLVVVAAAAARVAVGPAVVDRAEAGGGEGGEDARVGGDVFRGALAAAQSGGDQLEGVAAVDLGAGRAAGGAAVVAADEELAGGEGRGVEVLENVADLAGCGVEVVLGAVAVQADRVGAAAEPGELPEDTGQVTVGGEVAECPERGRGGAGEDGFSPSDWCCREGWATGAADAWPCRAAPEVKARQRRLCSRSRERRTTAATATEMAVTATAARSAVRTTPPTSTAATVFWSMETDGSERRTGAGSVGVWACASGGAGLSGYLGKNTNLSLSARLVM